MAELSSEYVHDVHKRLMILILQLYHRISQHPASEEDETKWSILNELKDWPLLTALSSTGHKMDIFSICVRIIRTGVFSHADLSMTLDEIRDFLL